VRQIAAEELGCDLDDVYTPKQDTYIAPNAPGTGGSTGTDVNGGAVIQACKKLRERLATVQEQTKGTKWKEVILLFFPSFLTCF